MLSIDQRDQPSHLIRQPVHYLRKRTAVSIELGIPRLTYSTHNSNWSHRHCCTSDSIVNPESPAP
eukprot:429306-Prymnesium_polylepis.1